MSTAFRIILDAGQEVGTGSTSTATGLGTAVFDSGATTLSYFLTITGLDFGELLNSGVPDTADPNDDVTLMHIHNAARGANGPVVFDILPLGSTDDADDLTHSQNPDGSRNLSGLWELTDPASTSLATFAAALGAATPGNDVSLYFNVHSAQFGGGVIRGQLVAIADDTANVVDGTDGDDRLPGLGGDDTINGGLGADLLEGGNGNDVLRGGFGNDFLVGGLGNDYYYAEHAGDVITELSGEGVDTVETELANYSMPFATENLVLAGSANNNATGNLGDNEMTGNAGANTLIGGQGDDVLRGMDGKDLLSGRGGFDEYVFTSLADSAVLFAGRDAITVFAHGDKINLSAIDANVNVAGDQAFTWTPGGFTGVAGQLYVQQNAARSWTVWADVDGDANADFALNIYGSIALNNGISAWDFIL